MPSLERFDYYDEDGVPTSFVQDVIAQNPSLETLGVNLDYPRRHKTSATGVLAEIKDLNNNGRFKTLVNLVIIMACSHFLLLIMNSGNDGYICHIYFRMRFTRECTTRIPIATLTRVFTTTAAAVDHNQTNFQSCTINCLIMFCIYLQFAFTLHYG